ncbi:hypothetical protein [Chryseosolibacter indicus]|uniref:Uncharacterized protein n=1 Tax=Chryseosolibacter indicus TaxID=2782351 RepID=A0ABS5VSB0_9BACT|nr:hypothetical protein [Chryseosolibacter indicus]MBT1704323.1 hypothetical protein [Chryseosolibacter indicus]
MKKLLTAKTRREFFISNIIGLIVVIALIIWFTILSINNTGIQLASPFLWSAFLLMLFIPFALITIFSAMKSVIVTEKGIIISYVFKKHKNEFSFSEVKEFIADKKNRKEGVESSSPRDSFRLHLADGRTFEFTRSQLDNYNKLKSTIYKAVSRK